MGAAFTKAHDKHRNIAARELCIELANHHLRWFSCAVSWFEEQDVGADAFYEPQRRHYLLLTIQDISQLKQQQEALRINGLRAVLSEQERIQGLRETLAGAVYQLEGPLNMLKAVAHMMERRLSSTPPTALSGGNSLLSASALEEAIHKSREALETLRACIPDLITEEMQPVNLNEVMADLLKLTTSELLGSGIVVEWIPSSTPAVLTGHPAQLANLFKQLLANAIEAINLKRGGRREIKISCLVHQDHFETLIEDSGPGIADDIRNKAFQPFFTTKGAAQQHIGLGLAMAQEVVSQHGGTIDFDPAFNNGCRVRVQLPSARGVVHV
jgi:nitrogen fixation negative regulator NifL